MAACNYSLLDHLIIAVDERLSRLIIPPVKSSRLYPAEGMDHPSLSEDERRQSAGLMRVNHAGEVSAQALYKAQALVARDRRVLQAMRTSALEELDHLAWCKRRLEELDDRVSMLDPFWFGGSFCIGLLAGMAGDKWSLGFIAETEEQVSRHLDGHLQEISVKDRRSRAILKQMRTDEAAHAVSARKTGMAELPEVVKRAMGLLSGIMTGTAYWL